LGAGQVAGLEVLAQLAEARGDRVLLDGELPGLVATMMTMVVSVPDARLLAGLLQVPLDGGKIGLRGVARFQILRQWRDGGTQRTAALRAGSRVSNEFCCPLGRSCSRDEKSLCAWEKFSRKQILA
jgi:hypothetical protein